MFDGISEPLAKSVLEQLQEGVAITEASLDAPGPRILWVNSVWERITGYTAEQAVGTTPAILQDSETWREDLDRIRSDLETTGFSKAEAISYRADGTTFHMFVSISPLHNEAGEITHFVVIARDISHQRNDSTLLRQLEALTRIQRKVATGGLDLDELRQLVADVAMEITGADGAVVEEVEGQEMIYTAVSGASKGKKGVRLPLEQSISGLAYREGVPLLCRDTATDDRAPLKETAREVGFISGVLVPLSHQGQILGVLKVVAGEVDRFDSEHLQLLRLASSVLAASLYKAVQYTEKMERHAMFLNAIPALISFIDREQRYQEVNTAYEKFFQLDSEEIHGRYIWELLGAEGYRRLHPYIDAALRGERVNYEIDVPFNEGKELTLQGDYFPQYGANGRVEGFYSVVRDITEARSAQIDYLTGLSNRRQFDREGTRLLELGRRHGEPVTLVLMDLDHFKTVNDTYGHQVGDEVLKGVAHLMRHICRQSDLAARWGGEEFVLLLPKSGANDGKKLAERLRSEIEKHEFPWVNAVTASLGTATTVAGDSIQDLIERADQAVYEAKKAGRNQVVTSATENYGGDNQIV